MKNERKKHTRKKMKKETMRRNDTKVRQKQQNEATKDR